MRKLRGTVRAEPLGAEGGRRLHLVDMTGERLAMDLSADQARGLSEQLGAAPAAPKRKKRNGAPAADPE